MSFVQQASSVTAGPTATPTAVVLPSVKLNSLVHVSVKAMSENRDVSSLGDGSNTYGLISAGKTTMDTRILTSYSARILSAGTLTISVVMDTSGATNIEIIAIEEDEIKDGTVLGTAENTISSFTQLAVGPLTPVPNTVLFITSGVSANTGRPLGTPSGFTGRVSITSNTVAVADKAILTAAAITATWTVSGGNAEIGGRLTMYEMQLAAAAKGLSFLPGFFTPRFAPERRRYQ